MNYAPIQKTLLVSDWKTLPNQAQMQCHLYFIFEVTELSGKRHMGIAMDTVYTPPLISFDSQGEFAKACKRNLDQAAETLWTRLAKQLDEDYYIDNMNDQRVDVKDVQPITDIPEPFQDMIHFYYAE